jgi:hypothetical protein
MLVCTVIVVTPARDDGEPPLPLLTRARLLIYPYIRRDRCEQRIESAGSCGCGCGCLWEDAIVGRDNNGVLWRDRSGMLPAGHTAADPEDEPRLVAHVDLLATGLVPKAVITPDGEVHHLSGDLYGWRYTTADLAILEDRLNEHPDCYAVPFTCRF